MVIAIDNTPVELRSEDGLHPIIWRGKQWAVTDFGIERLDGTYYISADRLGEKNVGKPDYPAWPLHMAKKTWVDIHDFCTAFLVALAFFHDEHSLSQPEILDALQMAVRAKERS